MNEREPAGQAAADERGESRTASNPGPSMTVDSPWARPADQIIHTFDVSLDEGLSSREARRRRQRYGPNRLRTAQTRSALSILIEQFKSVIIALLAGAAVVSFAFGEMVEALAIVVVIVINATIGFVTELRAVRAMEALQELTRVDSKVRRDGQVHELEAQDLVPGDIVLVDGGDIVTADLRLFEASKLQADESPLTGESTPVGKQTEPVEEDAPLAERASMLFKGTAVTRGSGKGVVVTTGMETELGNVSSLVEEAQEEKTPLERRLSQLGHRLIWVTLGVAALVTLSGTLRGRELLLMIRSGLALAVASIPEGLPIVATVALARGMWRMARRNAVVNRLSAVETLGSTSVILTDKTGTLTENRMTVTQLVLPSDDGTATRVNVSGEGLELEGEFTRDDDAIDPRDDDRLRRALEVGVLCNNATIQGYGPDEEPSSVGEPTEIALLVAGAKGGIRRDELTEPMPEQREVAFDPEVKMMATFHERPDGNDRFLVAVKGGVEAVIQKSNSILTENGTQELNDEQRQAWTQRGEELAQEGLRILAAATGQADSIDENPYQDLTFVGLYALLDPPRQEVQDSIAAVRKAGIRVVMVTGDQPATARYVARAVGLLDEGAVVHGGNIGSLKDLPDDEQQRILQASVLARVTPEQKLDLIALHQESGAIVAMTGDGVNDAPALKKADIGIAMGERGTQVAREAADMVLKDDNFSTIVEAIQQGRNIFNNIRKFVLYLLSCNGAEIVVVGLASVADAPLPIRPLQILFLNLVTDVFPALALGVGKGDPHILDRPPRDPEERVLTRRHWLSIAGYSAVIGAVVLGTLAIAILGLGMSEAKAVTVSFLTLAFAQLWHVFNMRDRDAGLINNDVVQNRWVWAALVLCTVLLLAAVYVPGLANVLRVEDPGTQGWVLILGMSLSPLMLSAAAEALRAM